MPYDPLLSGVAALSNAQGAARPTFLPEFGAPADVDTLRLRLEDIWERVSILIANAQDTEYRYPERFVWETVERMNIFQMTHGSALPTPLGVGHMHGDYSQEDIPLRPLVWDGENWLNYHLEASPEDSMLDVILRPILVSIAAVNPPSTQLVEDLRVELRGGVTTDRDTLKKLSDVIDGLADIVEAIGPDLALSGTPTAPTPAAGDNSTRIATTEYVRGEIDGLVGAAPGALDTLEELAAALNDDSNHAGNIISLLAEKERRSLPNHTALKAIAAPAHGDTLMLLGRTALGDASPRRVRFDSSNQTANVAADPLEALTIPTAADPTGATGAWRVVFKLSDWLPLDWWGPAADATFNVDGGTDDFRPVYYALNTGYKIDGQDLSCALVSRSFTQQTAAIPTAPTGINGLRIVREQLRVRNLWLTFRSPFYWGCRGVFSNDLAKDSDIKGLHVSMPANGYVSVVNPEAAGANDNGASNYTNTAMIYLQAASPSAKIRVWGCEVTGRYIGAGIRVLNFDQRALIAHNDVHDIEYDFIAAGNLAPTDDRINGVGAQYCKFVIAHGNRVSRLGGKYRSGETNYTSHRFTIGLVFGGCQNLHVRENWVEYVHQAYDYTGTDENLHIHHHDNTSFRCEVWTAKFANNSRHIWCYNNTSIQCLQGIVVSGPTSAHGRIYGNQLQDVGNFVSGRETEAGFVTTGVVEYGTGLISGVYLAANGSAYHPYGIEVYDNTIIGHAGGNMAYGVYDGTTPDPANQPVPNSAYRNTVLNAAVADYRGPLSRDLMVFRSANQAIAAGENTTVLFDKGPVEVGGVFPPFDPSMSYNPATGEYINKWGRSFKINAGVGLEETSAASAFFFCSIFIDRGAGYVTLPGAQARGDLQAAQNTTLSVSWSGWLNPGDKIKVVVFQSNATSTGLQIRAEPMTFFRICEQPSVPDALRWAA